MQEKLLIHGGQKLNGEVYISGAKNSALKLLAATLLASEPVTISNLPHLNDITIMLSLLGDLGCGVEIQQGLSVTVNTNTLLDTTVSYELVKAMRASIVVLGPLLARHGCARVALPGGCAIGPRPIDIHLAGLKAMGADIELKEGYIDAKVNGRLHGATIDMHTVTVTGTENLMMAAALADGVTIINNAAREPEVVDLAKFLIAMGAKIDGAGTSSITITGVEQLQGCRYQVIADRIEAGTYLAAAVMTSGDVTVKNVDIPSLQLVIEKFQQAGANMTIQGNDIHINMSGRMLRAVDIETAPYPGMATDLQAVFMAMNVVAAGVGMIAENIFENRFMHVAELQRLGASIKVKGDIAISAGVSKLIGAPVMARDLRAGACLVLAALVAEGETIIEGLEHIDRGYEYIEEKLNRLGADVRRVMQ